MLLMLLAQEALLQSYDDFIEPNQPSAMVSQYEDDLKVVFAAVITSQQSLRMLPRPWAIVHSSMLTNPKRPLPQRSPVKFTTDNDILPFNVGINLTNPINQQRQ
eukprot:TRINITY_DN103758_c0_g1_i1.p1 TRINITY_DN103758_c0_g1~~TRINITY_DN103758_c0_g1_i1.p1  ORF type:complete len:104 (+),score=14.85 TRINITY_DN103758_c0_g1_i1:171-482(+)